MSLVDEARAQTGPLLAEAKDVDLIRVAEQRGYVIHRPVPPSEPIELDLSRIKGKRVKLGIISDTHFGSKWQQPTAMRQAARLMKREGCSAILVPGDVTDGSTAMHPGFEYGLWAHGADAQVDVAVDDRTGFPDLGIPWYVIGGNHDASHYKAAGVDVIRSICERRPDMHYLGPQLANNHGGAIGYLQVGEVLVQLCHPHLGGTRTRSYRLETWIENLQAPKPKVVVMGNFHKYVEILYRSVWGLLVPSYQAQTTWMASKGIESIVGGMIIEFGTVTKGLAPDFHTRRVIEWEPRRNDWPGA